MGRPVHQHPSDAAPARPAGHLLCFLVSHTHWDREWYRTFEEFRARLVDTVDTVLDLLNADPGFAFVLDGQSIVVEDYLEVRPERRETLTRFCRQGRLAIGPWYVQPDSLLPAGETHVRNLLEGRRVAATFGRSSRVAYTPDSFGHPAQFPQLFRGFGLGPFVYWRGNGDEADALPLAYVWEGPDGSSIAAYLLAEGYFNSAGLPADPHAAAAFLTRAVERLRAMDPSPAVLLLHGIDHAFPQAHTAMVAAALSQRLGAEVRRATLDQFAAALPQPAARYCGELLGARFANLLPGVWSSRMPLKLWNRRCETLLLHWAEPWAALALVFGLADERPALRAAWRALLQNQAHDSIGGCSQDRVHEQMTVRFARAEELARETTRRVLERFAGLPPARETPWEEPWTIYVFNPSPYERTDVVRLPLDPHPWFGFRGDPERTFALHPIIASTVTSPGFLVNDTPARLVEEPEAPRLRLQLERPPRALEFVARNLPPFGCIRVELRSSTSTFEDIVDDGTEIRNEHIVARVNDDGTFDLTFADSGHTYRGLGDWEDSGDRGDTYDFDPVPGLGKLEGLERQRRCHPNGIQTLRIDRILRLPKGLTPERNRRSDDTVLLPLCVELRLAPGVPRLDIEVSLDNTACDHRLRLLFPTGQAAPRFFAATTFDIAERQPQARSGTSWVHPPPKTFPQQGFVSANGLTVTAPGLPEAEVLDDGTIAITLVRSVGWLALPGLSTRPELAGPTIATPGAQCLGILRARLALSSGVDPCAAVDLAAGLWAVFGSDTPMLRPNEPLLVVQPKDVLLSALLPAPGKRALWLRLLNPWNRRLRARVRFGFDVARVRSVRLDGRAVAEKFVHDGRTLECELRPHQLRSFALEL